VIQEPKPTPTLLKCRPNFLFSARPSGARITQAVTHCSCHRKRYNTYVL